MNSFRTVVDLRVRGGRALAAASLLMLTMCESPLEPTERGMSADGARTSLLASTDVVLVGAGNIASCANDNDQLTANILDTIPGTLKLALFSFEASNAAKAQAATAGPSDGWVLPSRLKLISDLSWFKR